MSKGRNAGTIERWRDWLRRQYVEGYYTGGRVHPHYLGPRPNRMGYVLLGSGILFVGLAVIGGLHGGLGNAVIPGAMAALQLLAGARLLRPREK